MNNKKISVNVKEQAKWGFTNFSEKINGRVAMMAFIILFFIELVTKHKIMDYIK